LNGEAPIAATGTSTGNSGDSTGYTSGTSGNSTSVASTSSTLSKPAPARKISTGSSTAASTADIVNVELRLFVNSGVYEFQVQASGAHKANLEISLPKEKFEVYTFENLKKRFGTKWPNLKPGGVLARHTGKITFKDSQTLKEVGIDTSQELVTTGFDIAFTVEK